MKNGRRNILIAVAALILIAVIIIFRQNKSRFNWYETYEIESKEPYGGYVIGDMLKNYFPGNKFTVLKKSLHETLESNNHRDRENYVFIGSWIRYDSSEINALLSFVDKGSSAFISSTDRWTDLLQRLLQDTCMNVEYDQYNSERDSIVSLNFYSSSIRSERGYPFTYVFRNLPYRYEWSYFDSSVFCGTDDNAVALGSMDTKYINFVKIRYGKGNFFLHTTPLAFTNYSLTKEKNLEYASHVFSFLPKGNILWDEYNKMPGDVDFNSDLKLSQSPLQYILGQESLRWAWYLTLLLVLLYMVFFGKRKQRVIPVIEPNTNTSLEYIKTISQLYYQQSNHKVICMHKMKLFQAFLRNRYFIQTNKINEEVVKKISVKSQIPEEEINTIFHKYNWIERNNDTSNDLLIEFHQLIEKFYKNCK